MLKKIALVSLFVLPNACGSAHDNFSTSAATESLSKNLPIFLDDNHYQEEFDSKVIPLIATARDGFFSGINGTKLYHQAFENPNAKGKIVIVNGYTENTLKYRELIYNFYQAGYSVYIYDHRGQGASDRLTKNRTLAHIQKWEHFQIDLRTFIDTIIPQNKLPTFIFSHSMGGAIVADSLVDDANSSGKTQYLSKVKAVVVSSPALALKDAAGSDGALLLPASLVARSAATFAPENYGVNQKPLDIESWTLESASTSSEPRFSRYKADAIAADQAMGGASFGWQAEVLKMNVDYSTSFTASNLLKLNNMVSKVKTPILMGQAGLDGLVFNPSQDQYCKFAANCNVANAHKPILFANSRHEIYNEKEAIRNVWITQIIQFFDSHLK